MSSKKAKSAAAPGKVVHKGTTTDGDEVVIVQYPEVKNKVGRVVNAGSRCQVYVAATGWKSLPFASVVQDSHTGVVNWRSKAEYLAPEKEGKVNPYAARVWKELTGEDLKP